MVDGSAGIKGDKDDGSDWLKEWDHVHSAWWDSVSVEEKTSFENHAGN